MRNLKRALSMALASVMVLGLTVVGAGAAGYQDFTDADEIQHTEAVSMITELGILAGLPDGSFGATQNFDRASFARLVCVVLNGGQEPVLGNLTTDFTTPRATGLRPTSPSASTAASSPAAATAPSVPATT